MQTNLVQLDDAYHAERQETGHVLTLEGFRL